MSECISIVGWPGSLEGTTFPTYYEHFGDHEKTFTGDLESITSDVTMSGLANILEMIEIASFESISLAYAESPHPDDSALQRLITAAQMTPDRFSFIWLKSFVANIILASKESRFEGLHYVIVSADIGAILVKTTETKTVHEANRTRLARLRWKFSSPM